LEVLVAHAGVFAEKCRAGQHTQGGVQQSAMQYALGDSLGFCV
jgi:hypothetical protein